MKQLARLIITSTLLIAPGFASAGLISITDSDLASDASTVNFENFSTGAVTGTESLFYHAGISQASFVGSSFANLDTLNVGNDGKALAVSDGELSIVDTNAPIDHITLDGGFTFELLGEVKQFGFQIVDEFSKLFQVETYSAGTLVDVISYVPMIGAPEIALFESDQYIDEFRVLLDFPTAAFGIDNITLADKNYNGTDPRDIPEPMSLLLVVFGLTSLGLARKRKNQ